MLSTDKITRAFNAIVQEAESLSKENLPDAVKEKLAVIRSIAKHQNDIRNAPQGSCSGHGRP